MGYDMKFERIEKKYLIDAMTFCKLVFRIAPYMQVDEYGRHTISTIYYDTEQFDLIRTSLAKPKYKEKLRLRAYGIPDENSQVYAEIKKKYKGIVYKRRVGYPYHMAIPFLDQGIIPEEFIRSKPDTRQITEEITYFLNFYHPKPQILISYERIAMFGKENHNIRMTFDQNIRSRAFDLDLRHGSYGNALLPQGMFLLEIKVPGGYPIWLTKALSDYQIFPTSFSKYGRIYSNAMLIQMNRNQIKDKHVDE